MDQNKIGRFIAERRKANALTQAALGEKLGVSNKAVSKWERGICLPDVSLYQDLCMVLGISLNELFAGEYIKKENLEMTSENNLISITTSGNKRKKKLVRMIAVLCGVLVISLAAIAVMAKNAYDEKNAAQEAAARAADISPLYHYIDTWNLTENEETLLGILREGDPDLNLFRYNTGSSFTGGFSVDMVVYEKGKEIRKETVYQMDYWEKVPHSGVIAVMTDWDDPSVFSVQATVNGAPGAEGTSKIDLSEYLNESWFEVSADGTKTLRDSVEMSRSELLTGEHEENDHGRLRIEEGTPIALALYGFNGGDGTGSGSIPDVNNLKDGTAACTTDEAVLFTVTFKK